MNRIKADLEKVDLLGQIHEKYMSICSELEFDPHKFHDFTQFFMEVIGRFDLERVKKFLQQLEQEGFRDRYPMNVIKMIAEKRKQELEKLDLMAVVGNMCRAFGIDTTCMKSWQEMFRVFVMQLDAKKLAYIAGMVEQVDDSHPEVQEMLGILEWAKRRNASVVVSEKVVAQRDATEEQQLQVCSSGDSGMQLVKSVLFDDAVQCDFYQNENNDVFMTSEQIGKALGYKFPAESVRKIVDRNAERFADKSVQVKLTSTDGKAYNTRLFNEKGIYEIIRKSNQPKADKFYDWVYDVLEGLRKGQLQIQPTNTNVNYEFQQQELEIRLRETKLKEAEMFIKMAEQFRDILPNTFVQSILANAAKTVGYDVSMFTPEQNKRGQAYMTATDIALETGSTSHMIGVLSNQFKLKRAEYGRWISAFMYNEKGKRKLLELLQKEDMRNMGSVMSV